MTGIKLEAGKTYLDREGNKRGPLVHVTEEIDTVFEYSLGKCNLAWAWREDGRMYNSFESPKDLIKEYIEVKEEPNAMTNYNDGTIHGWNGGECPVHPETVVEYWLRDGVPETIKAEGLWWSHETTGSDVIAFRVVKEYVEPKVIWVNEYPTGNSVYVSEELARKLVGANPTRIAVKYVEAIADAKECKE